MKNELMRVNERFTVYERKGVIGEQIKNSEDAAFLAMKCMKNYNLDYKEYFIVIFLDSNLVPLGFEKITEGSREQAVVDIRILLTAALCNAANAIIVAHNHPSRKMEPSKPDDRLTGKIGRSCNDIGLRFIDHIIIDNTHRYYSYRENGKL